MKSILLFIFISLPTVFFAQMNFTGGPLNIAGNCQALWADGEKAFMAYDDALYRTVDGGETWNLLSNGIPTDADPRTIEYSNDRLIVGCNDGAKVYISTDFGDSFMSLTNGMMVSFAPIPTASTSGENFSMMGGTTFGPHSFDFDSEMWIPEHGGITHGMSYVGKDTIWICSGSVTSGVTRYSHDNGGTWTEVANEPNTDVGGGVIIASIAQDFLKVGSRIIVASNFNGFPILYTDDNGETWSAGDLPSQAFSDYGKRFIKINDNHVLTVNASGIWKSTDRGETWTMIQSLGAIRTMVKWKENHILVGTDLGVYEYSDYGEGGLVKQHGIVTSSTNLVSTGNEIFTGTPAGIFQYSSSSNSWELIAEESMEGTKIIPLSLSVVEDTLYAFAQNRYFASGDNGLTFHNQSDDAFDFQKLSVVAKVKGKKFAASRHLGGGQPKEPRIYYSTDNGNSYSLASFTNNIAFGLGGLGGNYVENFIETSSAIVADMNAGFAISTDEGLTWTYYGGPWDQTFMASKGNQIYHFKYASISAEKVLEVSSDSGETWTAVGFEGLPNSGASNFKAYFGAWNLDGDICTYNAFEEPRGLYRLVSNQWELIDGTKGFVDDWDGITDIQFINDNYYFNWFLNGTWRSESVVSTKEPEISHQLNLYPNPFSDVLNIETESDHNTEVSIFNSAGILVNEFSLMGRKRSVDLSFLSSGLYVVSVRSKDVIRNFKTYKTN